MDQTRKYRSRQYASAIFAMTPMRISDVSAAAEELVGANIHGGMNGIKEVWTLHALLTLAKKDHRCSIEVGDLTIRFGSIMVFPSEHEGKVTLTSERTEIHEETPLNAFKRIMGGYPYDRD